MVFDPEEETDSLCRGFTTVTPTELPFPIPGRSLCDNMESQNQVTGAMRTRQMSRNGSNEGHVTAYDDVQFGNKAGSMDAAVFEKPEAGDYKDSGEGKYSAGMPPEMYENANEPLEKVDQAEADEDE